MTERTDQAGRTLSREPSPPAPPATPTTFTMGTPTLSRGNADRSEDLREPGRLHEKWSQARLLTMSGGGRVQLDPAGERLQFLEAASVAPTPPPGAVLLGAAR